MPAKTRPAARASRGAGSEPVWGSGAAPVEPLDDVGGCDELAPPLLEGVVVDDPAAEVEEVPDPLVDVDDVGGGVVVVHEVSEDDDEEEEGDVDVLDELVDDELVDEVLEDVDGVDDVADVLEELEELEELVDVDEEDPPQPGSCHCCPANHVESAARTSHCPPHAPSGSTPRNTVTGTRLGIVTRARRVCGPS